MNTIRITYAVLNDLKFIAHLDTTRLLFRLFRKLSLPIVYSQGFSPHPLVSFSPPRPVGIESLCECIDVKLNQPIDIEKTKSIINQFAPKGLVIKAIQYLKDTDFLLKEISKVVYRVDGFSAINIMLTSDSIEKFLARPEIIIKKVKKGKQTSLNIKPWINNLQLKDIFLHMELNIGNNTAPPFLLLESLLEADIGDVKKLNIVRVSVTP